MEFFEAPPFTRYLREYLVDEEYRNLQHLLAQNPELGVMMPGTGGFRKLRWADQRRGKGRRGGLRIHLLLLFRRTADLADDPVRKSRGRRSDSG